MSNESLTTTILFLLPSKLRRAFVFQKYLRFIFLLTFALLPQVQFAQTLPFDLWHEGEVVMAGRDTLKGLVKYDLNDFIEVRHDNQSEIFAPEKILSFGFFDQSSKRRRQFYSLAYENENGVKKTLLFELLSQGKITLLSREKIERRTSAKNAIGVNAPRIVRVIKNQYFLIQGNGNIEAFLKRPDGLYDLMGNLVVEVRAYAEKNKLAPDDKYQLKQIVDYYNSLNP